MSEFGRGNPEQNREINTRSIQIDSPEFAEFESGDMRDLVKRWRQNHAVLLPIIRRGDFPFFGLHGTTRSNLDKMIQTQEANVEMATFYKKNRSERFLYQLYVAGLYPVPYAMGQAAYREQSPGGIIVFNLNDKEGKNFTFEWEHLRPASFPGLTYDTAKEGRFIESLGRREGLLYRTKQDIKESFAERFKGYIDMNDLSKYHQEISKEDLTGLVRVIIRRRFLAQEIIARALELLGKQS